MYKINGNCRKLFLNFSTVCDQPERCYWTPIQSCS